MELTRQKVEAYLDDLVVKIYISQGKPEDLRKLSHAIFILQQTGHNLKYYRIMEQELINEYT